GRPTEPAVAIPVSLPLGRCLRPGRGRSPGRRVDPDNRRAGRTEGCGHGLRTGRSRAGHWAGERVPLTACTPRVCSNQELPDKTIQARSASEGRAQPLPSLALRANIAAPARGLVRPTRRKGLPAHLPEPLD